jgi:hypothetical protein
MTGIKKYFKIPLITRLFRISFYICWRDDKFERLGFQREKRMTLIEAITRLENKRLRRFC